MPRSGGGEPTEDGFFLTVPAGWSMVDARRVPGPETLGQLLSELAGAVPRDQIGRLTSTCEMLHKQFTQTNVVLMALRTHRGGEALDVLTVACPSHESEATRPRDAEATTSQPRDETPGEHAELPGGLDAIVHQSTARDLLRGDLEWSVVQVVMPIPGTELPVITTLTTTDARHVDVLKKEAKALAGTITRSPKASAGAASAV